MKKVYIIHGWDGSPDKPMLDWLKSRLTEKRFVVESPAMPNPETPQIDAWVEKLKEVVDLHNDIVFIGHSIGCQAVLRFIETLPNNFKIKGVVFIAPWMELDRNTIKEEGEKIAEVAKPWMETPIDFWEIKKRVKKSFAIFSDNDPYVPLSQKNLFEKELGAQIIVEKNKGHFTFNDGVVELPSALEAVLKIF